MKAYFSLFAVIHFFMAPAAAERSAPVEPMPVAAGAWAASIPGGPQVVMIPQRSVPMFAATVLVPAGSAMETPATSGAAHYLEHLLFNGTTTRTREEIYAEGDLLGAYNNASTQRERTVFQLMLPAENWEAGLELQADMLLHSTLPEAMFEKEKGIILEEMAKDRSNPEYAAQLFENQLLWDENARALPVLGSYESIEAMELATVRRFYKERYLPMGMTILLMGDFDAAKALEKIEKLYGASGNRMLTLSIRPHLPTGRTVHRQAMAELAGARLRVHMPLPAMTGADRVAGRVLESLLNDAEYSALDRAVEGLEAPARTWASLDADSHSPRLTLAADFPEGGAPQDAALRLLAHLAAIAAHGVAADDLEATRRSLASEEIGLREKMHYYGLMRAEALGSLPPEEALGWVDHLQGDLEARVRALAAAALADERLLITWVGNDVESGTGEAPATPTAAEAPWYTNAQSAATLPVRALVAPASADGRGSTPGIQRTRLANGVVFLNHTSPDARTFAAHVLIRDRAQIEETLGVPRGSSDVVHRMMTLGTADLDEGALRGKLGSLGTKLKTTDSDWIPYDDYSFSPEYSYVRLETIDAFAMEALALLGSVITAPRWQDEVFEKARRQAVERARKDRAAPRGAASVAFFATLDAQHPLAHGVYGPEADLEGLTLEQARALHAAMMQPENLIIAISSNLPMGEIEAVLNETFTDLPRASDATPAAKTEASPDTLPFPRRAEVATGKEQSWIYLGEPLDLADGDGPGVRLAAAVLSERLAERLREEEGLAYSIGASARISGDGPCWRVAAGTRPENLPRMEEGIAEVVAEFRSSPPSASEIEGARNRAEGRRRMRRLTRIGQAYALSMLELVGRDPCRPDADLPALRAVTPQEVARLAGHYFRLDRPVTAIAR